MMYTVHAIQSEKDGRIYVGFTENLSRRLRDHNDGKVFSTKGYKPWKLIYTEEMKTRNDARMREKYLKSGVGKEVLKKIHSAVAQR